MEKRAINARLMPGYGEGYSDGIRDGSEAGRQIAEEAYINSVKPIHIECPQRHCPVYKQMREAIIADIRAWAKQEVLSGVNGCDLLEKLDSMEPDKGGSK